MKDRFWDNPCGDNPFGIGPSQHTSQSPNDVFLTPLYLRDGRVYDLLEAHIRTVYDWQGRDDTTRWLVSIEAQERRCGDNILFHGHVLWGATRNERLSNYHAQRNPALLLITREHIEKFLRCHPEPARCCPHFQPIVLEIF